ncbi:MAG: hypothetical protein EZS28_002739 [Streblomastix strix]|uniref:Uncharacterized protein n=1 Tax=Streblomastix strix TaxID=222440 RepID=A0A5J4X4M0_9EUKA|nr:MAG: hypothetical protein EZS28_002739 [Streblomastix strix]
MLDQTSRQGAIAKLAKLVIMDQAIVDQIENQNQLLVIIADEIKVHDDGEEESADILSFAILALRVIHSSLVRIMHESSSIHFEMKVLSIIRNMEELLEKAGSIEDVNAALFRDNSDEDGVVDEAIYFTGQLQGFLRFS